METAGPPAIPKRTKASVNRRSLPAGSTHLRPSDANRVHVQPASPEVISSLITSLSIISSPVNELFEHSSESLPLARSEDSPRKAAHTVDQNKYESAPNGNGSFGLDYGAYKQPSLDELQDIGSLDEMAASPPVIRTAKPPSGFSPLTAPKSPKEGSFKSFLRANSRPSSRSSNDRDDASSIGNVSVERGVTPSRELKRQSSAESWGKKQGRNQKGLMYMSSKERLRERLPHLDSDSFLAHSPISEEIAAERGDSQLNTTTLSVAESPNIGPPSPALSTGSQGGIGSRYIPPRESSLRNRSSTRQKRTSYRSSRHDGQQSEREGDKTIREGDERSSQPSDRKARDSVDSHNGPSKMQEPLNSSPFPKEIKPTTLASKHVAESAKVDERQVLDNDEGAPSPAVAQRKSRIQENDSRRSSSVKAAKSGRQTPDLVKSEQSKRDGTRFKRLSAPLSPRDSIHKKLAPQENYRKGMVSPEPRPSQLGIDDRPTSADSIDDAVDSYLCSPRLSQKIRHPQTGRIISFSEVGDSEGFAVFCCVGMGLTKYITAFYDELALTLKLRLITPDRPGVGESEPYSDGTTTPLSWPDDVYAICQALKITKFSILAHSAGAIYALATALRMPQHIRGRIHLLAPWIPPSQLNVFGGKEISPPANSIPTSQRILRALPTPILKAANSSFMSATSSSITSSLPKSPRRGKRKSNVSKDLPAPVSSRMTVLPGPDKENQEPHCSASPKAGDKGPLDSAATNSSDPNHEQAILAAAAQSLAEKERQMTYDTRLTHAIWDLATSGANPAVDLLVCLERRHTIGFRYVDINRAVVIHHGSKDSRVPVENVKWLGRMMRRCEVRILEGEGHGLMASAGVMGGVLMEIAKEWEDWMRVVNKKEAAGDRTRTLRERASVSAFR
ncbi:MAG: hypothetical protein M1818_005305 [Claussenomyces sp. TS43310]|nr:MAG: hypothetical protein M1818_005305 [Claussenomyces sp. TS43310]